MPLWGFALCILCATLWAALPILVDRGLAVSDCTTNEVNPIRSLAFFFVTLIISMVWHGGMPPILTSKRIIFLLTANVLLDYVIGDAFYFIAIKKIGVSLSVPITNSYPIMAALTSWLMLGEVITLPVFIGITVVVAGLIALKLGEKGADEGEENVKRTKANLMTGFLLALTAGMTWAVGAPLNKMAVLESDLGAIDITLYRALIMMILVWVGRFFTARFAPDRIVPLKKIPLMGWVYFALAGMLGLSFGAMIYTASIAVMPVAVVTAITSTSPFMASMFGHFVLKDRLSLVQWAGVVLIIVGSIAVSL